MSSEEQNHPVSQSLKNDLQGVLSEMKEKKVLERYYAENPYVVLAAAAAAGYLVGGGLFSPFSRRLIRIGMRAVFLPVALNKFTELTSGN